MDYKVIFEFLDSMNMPIEYTDTVARMYIMDKFGVSSSASESIVKEWKTSHKALDNSSIV